jgi:hypothetical protein
MTETRQPWSLWPLLVVLLPLVVVGGVLWLMAAVLLQLVVIGRPQGHSPLLGVGLSTLGDEKLIPLTSGIALLIRDMTNTPMVRYGMIDRDRIRRVNEVLVRQSDRFSMAHSAPLLESIRRRTNVEPTPPLRVQVGGGPTSEARRRKTPGL